MLKVTSRRPPLYRPSCSRALTMGPRDTLMIPSRGLFISTMRKRAADAESAHTKSTRMTVALRGANRPKLP
jgi:hypothetical protein